MRILAAHNTLCIHREKYNGSSLGFKRTISTMKSRRRNDREDRLTDSQPKTRAGTSNNGGEDSIHIPIDLVMEILSRLPAKSIARFRCLSKPLASLLRLPDITEQFLTRSSSRPPLLFACQNEDDRELLFFSTPQPHNHREDSPPPLLLASYHMKIPFDYSKDAFRTIRGLFFLSDKVGKRVLSVICNPTTREYLTLPKAKTRKRAEITSYFGYDPVEKQYKILSMTVPTFPMGAHAVSEEHQVLTLGNEKPSWKMIKCCVPHYQKRGGICIEGVLYYPASTNYVSNVSMIVCFDVRFEQFRFIQHPVIEHPGGILINYNGKLGVIWTKELCVVREITTSFRLCILEDVKKEKWSEHTYVLSASCKSVFGDNFLEFVGVTRSNELVLSSCSGLPNQNRPYYIYYYNLERNTAVKIGIQGMEVFADDRVHTFVDHAENVKLMEMFQKPYYNLRSCRRT